MLLTGEEEINIDELRRLYRQKQSYKAIFDLFALRSYNKSETHVDKLVNYIAAMDSEARNSVVRFFKALEQAGCGRFIEGRRGKRSRFSWEVSLVDIGRIARGDQEKAESLKEDNFNDLIDESPQNHSENFIEHTYYLRTDNKITLRLPIDLTSAEITRLSDFIKTLPTKD